MCAPETCWGHDAEHCQSEPKGGGGWQQERAHQRLEGDTFKMVLADLGRSINAAIQKMSNSPVVDEVRIYRRFVPAAKPLPLAHRSRHFEDLARVIFIHHLWVEEHSVEFVPGLVCALQDVLKLMLNEITRALLCSDVNIRSVCSVAPLIVHKLLHVIAKKSPCIATGARFVTLETSAPSTLSVSKIDGAVGLICVTVAAGQVDKNVEQQHQVRPGAAAALSRPLH